MGSDQQAPMQIDAKNTLANPKRTAKQSLTPAARTMQIDAKNTLADPKRTETQPLTTAVGKKKARLEEQVPTSLQDADQAKATEAPENIEKLATRTEQEVPLQTGAKKKKTKGKQTKKPNEEDVDQAKTVRAP